MAKKPITPEEIMDEVRKLHTQDLVQLKNDFLTYFEEQKTAAKAKANLLEGGK